MDELTLHLERIMAAPRPVVFRAHVVAARLAQWWGPKGFTSPSVEFDPRVGNAYRIAMQPPDGDLFYLAGVFREVDAPSRLVYTFRWEDPNPDDRETIVAISLLDRGDSTVMQVEQGVFATEARRALHQQGWTESLDRLQELIAHRKWMVG
jgi:uncharacterized protein YndB with AHSA1/START domain